MELCSSFFVEPSDIGANDSQSTSSSESISTPNCLGASCAEPRELEVGGGKTCGIENIRGWRRVILHFTPSWFAIIMGTGIVSILLYDLPYNARWIQYIAIAMFCLNIVLFLSFFIISLLRYIMFPGLWGFMIQHPVQSLFIGTFPMGLCTIINMIVLVCVSWGEGMLTFAWALWWIDVAISCACCMYMPFVIMHIHDAKLSSMTAAWLLPIVSTIVAAASGALVAGALTQNYPNHALWTLITSYVLWGCGVPLAMVVLVMYFQRLALHHLPTPEVIVSVFLPLGPLGSGAFGIMKLGEVANILLPITNSLPAVNNGMAGGILYVLGFVTALVMWGFALVWLFFAVASITRTRFPFNMGFWGFVFPGGVFVLATNQIAKELPSIFFKVLTMIFTMTIVLLWIFVSVRTVEKTLTGKLIYSPCVQQYQKSRVTKTKTPTDDKGVCSGETSNGPSAPVSGSSSSQDGILDTAVAGKVQ
ncbi:Plasma membrane sulfite pump involved in sulfite metabolism [Orbilia ellipsospora]|uniref:Sulfite efflux pump SSU1 n=1 Tax=Orbilia ellipsospora TaxID=2528407 RepID=A0AAV9X5B6_9PEZI